jgi:hypothetical protein
VQPTAASSGLSSATASPSVGASPVNQLSECPAAISVLPSSTSGTVGGNFHDITGASNAAGDYSIYPDDCGPGTSVFTSDAPQALFIFEPEGAAGTVEVDLCAGDSTVDTILALGYCTGDPDAPFRCLAFDDDSCGTWNTTSRASFALDGSGRPVIIIASLWADSGPGSASFGDTGAFVLTYTYIPPSAAPTPSPTPSGSGPTPTPSFTPPPGLSEVPYPFPANWACFGSATFVVDGGRTTTFKYSIVILLEVLHRCASYTAGSVPGWILLV